MLRAKVEAKSGKIYWNFYMILSNTPTIIFISYIWWRWIKYAQIIINSIHLNWPLTLPTLQFCKFVRMCIYQSDSWTPYWDSMRNSPLSSPPTHISPLAHILLLHNLWYQALFFYREELLGISWKLVQLWISAQFLSYGLWSAIPL